MLSLRSNVNSAKKPFGLSKVCRFNVNFNKFMLIDDSIVLFRSANIVSRMSIVLEVKCICETRGCTLKGRTLVIKQSSRSESGEAEGDLIEHARKQAQDSDALWALHHLPTVLDSVTFPYDNSQGRLDKAFENGNNSSKIRVWRMTISEKLEPLAALEDPKEYAQVFYDILQGASLSFSVAPFAELCTVHRWLFTHVKILHRDLSPGNIMFRRSEGGKVYGVLNDFDLASRSNSESSNGPISNQRTGTRPYMALDLLNTESTSDHKYRHDLESLFYIIFCLACRYEKPGHLLVDPPYDDWFSGTDYSIWKAKLSAFFYCSKVTPYFSEFSPWVTALHEMISVSVVLKVLAFYKKEQEFTYDRVKGIMSTFAGVPLEERWF